MEGKGTGKNVIIDPLKVRSTIVNTSAFSGYQQPTNEEIITSFWNSHIDFEDSSIQVDKSPFIVMENTSMSKIHFLFIMLNVSNLTVLRKGVIQGIITKHEFIMKRRSEDVPKKSIK